MPEKLAVDCSLRNSAAIDRYIFLVFARAILMDDFRKKFLTLPAFACDEHRQVDGSHADCATDGIQEGWGVADDGETLFGLFYFCR